MARKVRRFTDEDILRFIAHNLPSNDRDRVF